MDNVLREVAIMKKISHKNVINLVEVLDDSGSDHLILVIELLEGGCLGEDGEGLPEANVRHYARDIALGLEYLHTHNILHRDLKPENLLLTKDNHVKIADFGMSFVFEGDDDMVHSTAGTAAFMSPEMCAADGEDFSGKKVDLWALGVTLFLLFYGSLPFGDADGSSWDIYEAVMKEPLTFPERTISAPFRDVLSRLMDKDVKTRLTMKELRNHPWISNNGEDPLPAQECKLVSLAESDVRDAITPVSRAASLARLHSPIVDKLVLHRAQRSDQTDATRRSLSAPPKQGVSSPSSGVLDHPSVAHLTLHDRLERLSKS